MKISSASCILRNLRRSVLVAKLSSDNDRRNACIIAVCLIDKCSDLHTEDDDRYSCHILLCFQPVEQTYIDCRNTPVLYESSTGQHAEARMGLS
jgi:hypothetical protein